VIDCKAVVHQADQAKQQDQQHRSAFEHQHQHRRELNVLPGTIPGRQDAGAKQRDEWDVQPHHFEQLAGKDRKARHACHRDAEIGPDQ
jgi:hypothetical protein